MSLKYNKNLISRAKDFRKRMTPQERTKILNAYNLLVIRYTNNDISNNFEGVCLNIDIEVKRRLL